MYGISTFEMYRDPCSIVWNWHFWDVWNLHNLEGTNVSATSKIVFQFYVLHPFPMVVNNLIYTVGSHSILIYL